MSGVLITGHDHNYLHHRAATATSSAAAATRLGHLGIAGCPDIAVVPVGRKL